MFNNCRKLKLWTDRQIDGHRSALYISIVIKFLFILGTRCSTDFAEVPSTLMEYFAGDPRVLSRINKHYRTGEKLPDHVIDKLCATRKIFSGVELQAQLVFSAVDQVLIT